MGNIFFSRLHLSVPVTIIINLMSVLGEQVVVEGIVGEDGAGHVVLDDFSMTPACEVSLNQKLPGEDELTTPSPLCLPGQLVCGNGNCYNPIESCNFINDCGDWTDEKGCSEFYFLFCYITRWFE